MLTSNNVILQMFQRLIKCSKYICYKASNCPAKVKIEHQEDTCRGTHLENHMNWSFELRIMYETLSSYVCLHVVYADIALTTCSSWSSHELTSSQKPSTGMYVSYCKYGTGVLSCCGLLRQHWRLLHTQNSPEYLQTCNLFGCRPHSKVIWSAFRR
jgi:hypothetical protein